MSDQEVPAPDAVEQALPVEERAVAGEPSAGPEAPEADALEQSLVETLDEDGIAR